MKDIFLCILNFVFIYIDTNWVHNRIEISNERYKQVYIKLEFRANFGFNSIQILVIDEALSQKNIAISFVHFV